MTLLILKNGRRNFFAKKNIEALFLSSRPLRCRCHGFGPQTLPLSILIKPYVTPPTLDAKLQILNHKPYRPEQDDNYQIFGKCHTSNQTYMTYEASTDVFSGPDIVKSIIFCQLFSTRQSIIGIGYLSRTFGESLVSLRFYIIPLVDG